MNTTLFQIVLAVIEDINQQAFNDKPYTLEQQSAKVKQLSELIKLVFHNENKQEIERELFRIAQDCKNGLNATCGTTAMELLQEYMNS